MKKLRKGVIFIIIMMVFAISLTGCGSETKNNTTNSSAKSNTSTTKNGSSSGNTDKSETNSNTETNVEDINFLETAEKQVAVPEKGETIAILHIKNYGDIKVKFFKEIAPKAVENFIEHSKEGYYNGLTFHRVINDFMIQGGDPTGTGAGGESIWGESFEDEFSFDVAPYRGALCMANSGANTNGSQFFIEQANYDEQTAKMLLQYGYPENLIDAYEKYGGSMHLFFAHTVFGQVIEGMEIVDKIAATETDGDNRPVEDVVIESIEITQY